MGLEECHKVILSLPLIGKKIQWKNGSHEDTEIGHCKGNQVGVHDSSQVGPREDNQAEDVSQDAYTNNDFGNNAIRDAIDGLDGFIHGFLSGRVKVVIGCVSVVVAQVE